MTFQLRTFRLDLNACSELEYLIRFLEVTSHWDFLKVIALNHGPDAWNRTYVIRSRIEVAVLFPDHLRVHGDRREIHVEDIDLNSGSLRLEERSWRWENSTL